MRYGGGHRTDSVGVEDTGHGEEEEGRHRCAGVSPVGPAGHRGAMKKVTTYLAFSCSIINSE